MSNVQKIIKNRYPIYLKKELEETNITLSHAMIISDTKSIFVSETLEQITKEPLNDLFFVHERGMIPSNKDDFDEAFLSVQFSLLKLAGTFDTINLDKLKYKSGTYYHLEASKVSA